MSAELNGLSGVPGGPRGRWVTVLACGVLPAALAAATVAVPAALWSRLPGQVAGHWTLTGTAGGTMPRLTVFLTLGLLAVPGLGLVLSGWAAARRGTVARGQAASAGTTDATALAGTGLFIMAVSASFVIMVAVANLGGGTRPASVGLPGLVAPLGGSALLAALAGHAARRWGCLGAAGGEGPRQSLGLRAGELAVWSGRARAGWAGPAGIALMLAGAVAGAVTVRWLPAVSLVLAGAALLGFTAVRVTVSARGVMVGYGAPGLRLTRIPLRRIASAEAVQRVPFAFGYRGSLLLLGAAAVVVRHGPALRLTLRDGKTFLVTVDDAATGAALLNDLIAAAVAR